MSSTPYRYQEYPRHLHKPDGAFIEVHSDEERDAAVAAGWSLEPVAAAETPSDAPADAGMADSNESAPPADAPRRRGRPRKGE